MGSTNMNPPGSNWFNHNWFEPPSNPISFPNFLSLTLPKKPPFSSISLSSDHQSNPPGKHQKMLQQFWWECENLPDYRHTPQVEQALLENPVFEEKQNPTQKELEENKKWWEEFRSSPVVQFLMRAEEISEALNEMEVKNNSVPYNREDKKLWRNVPNVIGLDGRPMPRKAIKSDGEADDKFWDFAKQFFFGLWGFRQRPYPPGRPIDAAQVIGYKQLEKRYYDCEYWFCLLWVYFDVLSELIDSYLKLRGNVSLSGLLGYN